MTRCNTNFHLSILTVFLEFFQQLLLQDRGGKVCKHLLATSDVACLLAVSNRIRRVALEDDEDFSSPRLLQHRWYSILLTSVSYLFMSTHMSEDKKNENLKSTSTSSRRCIDS